MDSAEARVTNLRVLDFLLNFIPERERFAIAPNALKAYSLERPSENPLNKSS